MDLKGAEIRNIIDLCKDIGGKGEVPLCINITNALISGRKNR